MTTTTDTPATPRRDWMKISADYNGEDDRERIQAAIDSLRWRKATDKLSVPMMPAMAIQEAIKQLRLPKVSKVAWSAIGIDYPDGDSGGTAHYGLYGIEANYRNGRVRLYLLDLGSSSLPLCADHWPS